MKTLISSEGNSLKSSFDLRFGRAGWFCLLDENNGDALFFENEFKDESHGAGGKVVEKAIELGVTKVISGDFGPKAKDLLEKFKIQMVILPDENRSIKEIISQLK
jgi:predicted Fe-Mo cluster-binding NifX family protein